MSGASADSRARAVAIDPVEVDRPARLDQAGGVDHGVGAGDQPLQARLVGKVAPDDLRLDAGSEGSGVQRRISSRNFQP